MRWGLLLLTGWLLASAPAAAQTDLNDSAAVSVAEVVPIPDAEPYPSPRRAALLAAALPGLGQVYNRKYWKLPIVYGGVAGFIYALNFNNTRYIEFRDAFIFRNDGDPGTVDDLPQFNDRTLRRGRDGFRRNRDLTVILGFVGYGLSIVDALVDAHLAGFNVSDDLSWRCEPALLPVPQGAAVGFAPGVRLTHSF